MASTTQPSKEQVRQWFQERQVKRTPPPDPNEIRRQLGWGLVYNIDQRVQECAR